MKYSCFIQLDIFLNIGKIQSLNNCCRKPKRNDPAESLSKKTELFQTDKVEVKAAYY